MLAEQAVARSRGRCPAQEMRAGCVARLVTWRAERSARRVIVCCGSPREGEEQDALGICAVEQEVAHPVRERVGLARARARDDEQWAGELVGKTVGAILAAARCLGFRPLRCS